MKYRYQKPDKTANGKIVTTLLNHGIRNDTMVYSPHDDDRWVAWNVGNSFGYIEVIFTPSKFSYFQDTILLNDRLVTITDKVYKQIIRKLSEHQIMQILES
jgi:hypothetical protein